MARMHALAVVAAVALFLFAAWVACAVLGEPDDEYPESW